MDGAFGFGIATVAADGTILDTRFSEFGLGEKAGRLPEISAAQHSHASLRSVSLKAVALSINLAKAPLDASDVYLRLHLLSARHVKPHGLSLDGIFGLLANVVWTSFGPCAVAEFSQVREKIITHNGFIAVYGVDKFPRMVDYVIPDGVRIADADRVRLGAHLASGTTVMHEGFVNFRSEEHHV